MQKENRINSNNGKVSDERKHNKRRFSKIFIPVAAFCVLTVTIAIVVPIAIGKNNQQKELVFDTSLDELLSCCLIYPFHGRADAEPMPKTTISSIYNIYKNDSDLMSEIKQSCEAYTLFEEKAYHCIYAKKEICDIVNDVDPSEYRAFPQMPRCGITIFVSLCKYGPLDYETESKLLKERVYQNDSNCVDVQIDDDYYLLDIIKYYKDPNFDDNYFVDFISFSSDGQNAFLQNTESNPVNRYLYCNLYYPYTRLSSDLPDEKYKYFYKHTLDYLSLEVEKRNNINVVEDMFYYCSQYNSSYYNKIDRCIIDKNYLYTENDFSYFNAVFNYRKLVRLFGFRVKWQGLL